MFAQLFNLKTGQVLVEKNYDDEYQMIVSTETNGIKSRVKLSYESEEMRDAAFSAYSFDLAREFYTNMKNKTR